MFSLYRRVLAFAKPYWTTVLGGLACTLVMAAGSILLPPLIGYVFAAIQNQDLRQITLGALGALAIYFVQGWANYGQLYLTHYVTQRAITDMRIKFFRHLQDLSLDFYTSWHSGEIISRTVNDINVIQQALLNNISEMLPRAFVLIGLIIYIFFLNWRLSLLAVIVVPGFALLIGRFGQQMREASSKVQEKAADVASLVQEALAGVHIIKSSATEKHEIRKFTKESERSFYYLMKGSQVYATQGPVMTFLQVAATVIVIWYGGYEVVRGRLAANQLVSFIVAAGLLADPVAVLSKSYMIVQQAIAAAERVFEVIDLKPSVVEVPGAKELPPIKGEVVFDRVDFGYGSGPVLKGISFRARPGEVIALVGPSGAGKSTLVNLLPRFYDPTAGAIFIDGEDIKGLTLGSLRKQIGYVPQEPILFSGTISGNIAYGSFDAPPDKIEAAARAANAHEFISKLPQGYENEIGEGGADLSQGQKQRLTIARALLRDPRILILDEATSSLDSESEKLVQEALEHLMKGRTSFVIAHRLSTIQDAHRILVIDQGRIVEAGTHQELLAKGGIYRKLYEHQFR